MKKHLLCGIDVGSKELAVAVDPGTGRVWEGVFANDAAGRRKLIRRLTRPAPGTDAARELDVDPPEGCRQMHHRQP